MIFLMGSLARSGKVKYQTPKVPKSSDTSSYQGGCSKYKIKSSTNRTYSAGAHRLEKSFGEELSEYDDQYKKETQRCDWVAERSNVKQAEPVLMNSFHKFNSEKGFDRVDWLRVKKEETARKKIIRNQRDSNARNHKKWHRNHPEDGFYQQRTTDDFVECEMEELLEE